MDTHHSMTQGWFFFFRSPTTQSSTKLYQTVGVVSSWLTRTLAIAYPIFLWRPYSVNIFKVHRRCILEKIIQWIGFITHRVRRLTSIMSTSTSPTCEIRLIHLALIIRALVWNVHLHICPVSHLPIIDQIGLLRSRSTLVLIPQVWHPEAQPPWLHSHRLDMDFIDILGNIDDII